MKIDINKNTENLKMCLLAQGSKDPSAAEYKPTAPINDKRINIKIIKKFKFIIL